MDSLCRDAKCACISYVVLTWRCSDSDNSIPCLRCKRDNLECVLGGSNRGGRRERKKKRVDESQSQSESLPQQPLPSLANTAPEGSFHTLGNLGTTWSQDPGVQPFGEELQASRSGSSNTDELPFSNLQNPSDALGILARVAGESSSNDEINGTGRNNSIGHARGSSLSMPAPLSFSYPLLDRGILTVHSLCQLLVRFQQQYHPYYPLAPAHAFETSRLSDMVNNEKHLLTASRSRASTASMPASPPAANVETRLFMCSEQAS